MAYNFKVKYQFNTETGYEEAVIPELNYISSFVKNFEEEEEKIKEATFLEALINETK